MFHEIRPWSLLSPLQVKQEIGSIMTKLIQNYKDGQEDKLQEAWDYVQAQVRGAVGRVSACLRLGVCVSDEIMLASLYGSAYRSDGSGAS